MNPTFEKSIPGAVMLAIGGAAVVGLRAVSTVRLHRTIPVVALKVLVRRFYWTMVGEGRDHLDRQPLHQPTPVSGELNLG